VLARRRRLLLISVPAAVVFLAISFAVARFLTTEGRERDAVYALVRAEAAGDERAVLRRLAGCDAACAAAVHGFLPRLADGRRPAAVKIARIDSATAYSLGRAEGWTRVVWVRDPKARPVVQCVRVRRNGSPLTGRSVSLLRVRAPLADNEGPC
jgi:hypothetical protein